MLSGQGFNQSFGTTKGHPYLSSTLRKQGELITQYYGVASSSLASEIALISGQGPTQDTAANCPVFTPIAPTGNAAGAQVTGNGCVYPQATQSLPTELADNGNTWRAYIQGIDQGAAGQPKSCRTAGRGRRRSKSGGDHDRPIRDLPQPVRVLRRADHRDTVRAGRRRPGQARQGPQAGEDARPTSPTSPRMPATTAPTPRAPPERRRAWRSPTSSSRPSSRRSRPRRPTSTTA